MITELEKEVGRTLSYWNDYCQDATFALSRRWYASQVPLTESGLQKNQFYTVGWVWAQFLPYYYIYIWVQVILEGLKNCLVQIAEKSQRSVYCFHICILPFQTMKANRVRLKSGEICTELTSSSFLTLCYWQKIYIYICMDRQKVKGNWQTIKSIFRKIRLSGLCILQFTLLCSASCQTKVTCAEGSNMLSL